MTPERERTVFSTGRGRICPHCGLPVAGCVCRASPRAPRGDGVVRVRREVQGRNGKTVTTVQGVPLPEEDLRALATDLKRSCGTGGTAKDGVIEIQGDHRERLVRELAARGFTVKLAGG